MPTRSYPLGRVVEHDERSRLYRTAQAGGPLTSVMWKRGGSIFNQKIGSCTGNAIAGACNTGPLHKWYARYKTEADAVKAYSLATRLDGVPGEYPPEDTGSSGLAACKAAVQLGWIRAYHHAFSLDEALRALMLGPVLFGTNWYGSMDYPDYTTSTVVITPRSTVEGGHEWEGLGLDVERRRVRAANSWGPEWGDKGYFWIGFDTLERLLHEDGDCTVPVR